MSVKQALVSGCFVAALAAACAQFSSGECTDKALCDPNEASTNDKTTTDSPGVDVTIDNVVGPDGNVPEGQCNGGVEDCGNGKDDNCDGKIDCADPLCQGAGYSCVAPSPGNGWQGPVAWFNQTGDTIPPCAGIYATQAAGGHAGVNAPAATCSCGCTGPTSVQCSSVGVNYYTDMSCTTSAGSAGLPTNFCVTTGSGKSVSGQATATSYNGNCGTSPSKTVPPISWTQSEAVCLYDGLYDTGGCTNSNVCMQGPPSGAYAKACIYQTGDLACPGAPYTQKTVFYSGVDDQRTCTACTCTASAGTCTAQITVYDTASCPGGTFIGIMTDGACHQFSGVSAIAGTISTTPGTCGQGSTGAPTGAASGTGPVTVCCP